MTNGYGYSLMIKLPLWENNKLADQKSQFREGKWTKLLRRGNRVRKKMRRTPRNEIRDEKRENESKDKMVVLVHVQTIMAYKKRGRGWKRLQKVYGMR